MLPRSLLSVLPLLQTLFRHPPQTLLQKLLPQTSALPPNLMIRLGRWGWQTVWHLMMSQLAPRDRSGAYLRPDSAFRHHIVAAAIPASAQDPTAQDPTAQDPTAQGSKPNDGYTFTAASQRYRLLVGLSCPWAHRTLLVRSLKGLSSALPVVLLRPAPEAGGWVFEQPFDFAPSVAQLSPATAQLHTCQTLAQFYRRAQPGYRGRSTVPILWDSETGQIVNNESGDIIVILNEAFNAFAEQPALDLYPEALRHRIDTWNRKIYPAINNGVYRCGFAQTQAAYDQAVDQLFAALDEIDGVLAQQRYLCGDRLTLADVRLFTTLIRFDVAYLGLFRCDRRPIAQYPQLSGYLRDIYQLPGVAETCDLEAVKRDYYGNLFPLNPGGIIPTGPDLSWLSEPHHRQ